MRPGLTLARRSSLAALLPVLLGLPALAACRPDTSGPPLVLEPGDLRAPVADLQARLVADLVLACVAPEGASLAVGAAAIHFVFPEEPACYWLSEDSGCDERELLDSCSRAPGQPPAVRCDRGCDAALCFDLTFDARLTVDGNDSLLQGALLGQAGPIPFGYHIPPPISARWSDELELPLAYGTGRVGRVVANLAYGEDQSLDMTLRLARVERDANSDWQAVWIGVCSRREGPPA